MSKIAAEEQKKKCNIRAEVKLGLIKCLYLRN